MSRRHPHKLFRLFCLTVPLAACGCIERSLTFTTSPPGALVYLNDEEIGHSPIRRPFLWYGNYDVAVRMDGYETLKTKQDVKPPLCQIVPFDLFAEILPFQFRDDQSFSYTLKPLPVPSTQEMIHRAEDMKAQLQGPTTNPAK